MHEWNRFTRWRATLTFKGAELVSNPIIVYSCLHVCIDPIWILISASVKPHNKCQVYFHATKARAQWWWKYKNSWWSVSFTWDSVEASYLKHIDFWTLPSPTKASVQSCWLLALLCWREADIQLELRTQDIVESFSMLSFKENDVMGLKSREFYVFTTWVTRKRNQNLHKNVNPQSESSKPLASR